MTTHELKTWPSSFEGLVTGAKTHEWRRDDRAFAVGDVLWLREWDPATATYTGRDARRVVTFKTNDERLGVPRGFCVLSVAPESPVGLPAPLVDDGYRVRLPDGRIAFEYKHAELECADPKLSADVIGRMVALYNVEAVRCGQCRGFHPAEHACTPATDETRRGSDVTEGLVAMLRSRDAHGFRKYGTTLDRGDLSFDAWMQHLLEELLDAAGYVQSARRERRLADARSGENRGADAGTRLEEVRGLVADLRSEVGRRAAYDESARSQLIDVENRLAFIVEKARNA